MKANKKQINCGAWCKKCGKQETRYGRDRGVYTYDCLNCGNKGHGYTANFSAKKPLKIGVIYG